MRGVLPSIRVPTLVLNRRGDTAVNPDHSRYLAEHIAGARHVELEGVDNMFSAGDLDETMDEIEQFLTGTRPEREPDRMLATVLFTDIVGSTRRAAALGDRAWRETLERHDDLMRTAIARHRGREVKHTGDGFLATFDGPARGIRCAASVAEALGSLGLEVRAGLHTGECEVRDGDLGGLAVHIAARVMGAAGRRRGARLEHRQGPRRRLGDRLRRPRRARAARRPGRVAPVQRPLKDRYLPAEKGLGPSCAAFFSPPPSPACSPWPSPPSRTGPPVT